jgi:DNA mismatch endonuclease (patch repair protein)
MDNLTREQRSYCMSRVKGRDTGLERLVGAALRAHGLRFQTHVKTLPGRPDIVFSSARVAVFIDGDFWHGYRFPRWVHTISPFWRAKIGRNRDRDRRNFRRLRGLGWQVVRIWQHEAERDVAKAAGRVLEALRSRTALASVLRVDASSLAT